jgi:hypothetical protein
MLGLGVAVAVAAGLAAGAGLACGAIVGVADGADCGLTFVVSVTLGASVAIELTAADGTVELPAFSLELEHAANAVIIDKVRKNPHRLLVILIPHGIVYSNLPNYQAIVAKLQHILSPKSNRNKRMELGQRREGMGIGGFIAKRVFLTGAFTVVRSD